MTWNRNQAPYELGKPVVTFPDGVETPRSVGLSASRMTADQDGKKTFPAGAVISRIGSSYHIHPGATVTAAFSASATTGTIDLPRIFKAGDVLTVPEGHHVITFTGTWTTGGNVNVTLPNGVIKAIATGAGGSTSMTTTAVATKVATELNNDPIASGWLFAISLANVVYVYNKRDRNSSLFAVASTSNADDVALVTRAPFTRVGTISSISAAGVVTLTANAAIAVPVGAHIAVVVDEIIGIYPQPIDMTYKDSWNIAPVVGAHGIYEQVLPYFDSYVKASLPKILFAEKF